MDLPPILMGSSLAHTTPQQVLLKSTRYFFHESANNTHTHTMKIKHNLLGGGNKVRHILC